MGNDGRYSSWQLIILFGLRILLGWHMLYEGVAKLLNPAWSSAEYLLESKWIFSGLFHWIVMHKEVLNTVDFINTWGLIAIGLGLIMGLLTKTAAISGAFLLGLYYLAVPPLTGLTYSIPFEGNYLVVNKTLIEVFALLVLAVFPIGTLSLDAYITRLKSCKHREN